MLQIIFKKIILKGVFVFILETLHFYYGFCFYLFGFFFRFFFPEANIFLRIWDVFLFLLFFVLRSLALP